MIVFLEVYWYTNLLIDRSTNEGSSIASYKKDTAYYMGSTKNNSVGSMANKAVDYSGNSAVVQNENDFKKKAVKVAKGILRLIIS